MPTTQQEDASHQPVPVNGAAPANAQMANPAGQTPNTGAAAQKTRTTSTPTGGPPQ